MVDSQEKKKLGHLFIFLQITLKYKIMHVNGQEREKYSLTIITGSTATCHWNGYFPSWEN
jgi:hypothetical protein